MGDRSSARAVPVHRRLTTLPRPLRAIIGAIVGVTVPLAGALGWVAAGVEGLFIGLPLVALSLAGLLFGWVAAVTTFGAAIVTFAALAVLDTGPGSFAQDLLRLSSFVVGGPIIILLLRRADHDRADAIGARDGARTAMAEADAERDRLEAVRRDLDAALAGAERERARLEEVAEAIPEPLIVYDDQLRGTYGNRAAMRLFGRSFVERPLDEWGRSTEPRDDHGAPLERDEWPQVMAQRAAFRRRITLRVPMSGRDLIADVEGTPIPGGGAVLLLRDIGKEEDQRRRLSRFASFVAHELRNPLAVAKARIELAQRDPNLSTRASGHGARALESVDAAIAILERLELYSRADSGHVEARRERFELNGALGAAIERLRTRGSERQVLVELDPDVVVIGDRYLTEQAITNLLTNADRYSVVGAPIHVEVRDGDQVTLRVRDEGPGIEDDVADRLFRDRVAAGRGLGLGLFLVHATMAAMGGSVQLEERHPAAVFALRWDRAEP
ncbi:MAG: ATP-binding protein [Thermoleophilaceae bacterium]